MGYGDRQKLQIKLQKLIIYKDKTEVIVVALGQRAQQIRLYTLNFPDTYYFPMYKEISLSSTRTKVADQTPKYWDNIANKRNQGKIQKEKNDKLKKQNKGYRKKRPSTIKFMQITQTENIIIYEQKAI